MKKSCFGKHNGGFTLVELGIVLAIMGLILAVIFLALSGAQQARRDSRRQLYLQQVAQSLDRYKDSASNQFSYPPTNLAFNNAFQVIAPVGIYAVTADDTDPSGGALYAFVTSMPSATFTAPAQIYYKPLFDCNGDNKTGVYSLYISLEAAGPYCFDNH